VSAFQSQITRHFNLLPELAQEISLPPFHAAQQDIYDTLARYKVLVCGRKFGKTSYAEIDLCRDATQEAYPYGFCSLTYKSLSDSWNTVNRYLYGYIAHKDTSAKRLTLLNGSIIEFWSMENPEVVRPKKYKKLVIDEAAAVRNLKYVWEDILSPTLAPYEGSAVLLSTPRGKLNHFYELFKLGQSDPEWHSWQLPTWLNPNIPAREIDAMRRRMSPEAFAQEVEAQFTVREGAVFPNFDETLNTSMDAVYVEGYDVEWFMDWGYSNPSCILLAQERPYGNVPDALVVFDMIYVDHMVMGAVLEEAHRLPYPPPEVFIYDPSMAVLYAEMSMLRDREGWYTNIVGGNNTHAASEAVRRWICDAQNMRRLIIHPQKCRVLIEEIMDYHYNPNTTATIGGDPKVEKVNDHACFVAGTLITTIKGQVPIENIQLGDMVLTRSGWYPVEAVGMTNAQAQVMTVWFSDGNVITATPDHPIWVEGSGYLRIDALANRSDATKMTSLDFVPVAMQCVHLEAEPSAVYALRIGDPVGEYFANGILVKNCDALRMGMLNRLYR